MGKLEVKFYFTHRSSPNWPYPVVILYFGGKSVSANSYSKELEGILEKRLRGTYG